MKIEQMLKQEISTLSKGVVGRTDASNIAILIGFSDGTFHHILPDDSSVTKELVTACAEYIGANAAIKDAPSVKDIVEEIPSSIIFKNRQAIGDILCMTAAVRDFKKAFPDTRVGVSTTAMHLWDNNPNIDHSFREQAFEKDIGPGFGTNRSNAWNIHLIDAFRIDMETKLGLTIPKGELRPDIWMTEEEKTRPPIIAGPYWIIVPGGAPGWPAKQYHRWQEVVDALKDKITFVQIGAKGNPWPVLKNTVNMVGKTEERATGVRDLFNLFYHAQGSIGLVSMHMHLSAAFGNPCVVVAGAREPAWFTHYFGHQYLSTNGTLRCGLHSACWACKIEGCKYLAENPKSRILNYSVPKCVDIIEPEDVVAALLKYYDGGRLEFRKKVPNTFFKNFAKHQKLFCAAPAPKIDKEDEVLVAKSGMTFGGGSLTDRDWLFMKKTILDNEVKTVLEFGAGLSTLLLGSVVDKVLTFEMSPGWIKKISVLADREKNEIRQWDGLSIGSFCGANFDMAFVDGPSGGQSREFSTKIAAALAEIVVVHDAGREPERRWQKEYLEPSFKMVGKGGHRCHLWVRQSKEEKTLELEKEAETASKISAAAAVGGHRTAIVVTTCRGYGGSERSTIELMKQLQLKGYEVYLAPTGKISSEYANNVPVGVRHLSWDKLRGATPDLLLFYTSDTIWNFNLDQYVSTIPTIDAGRKVMVLNFQLGSVGQSDWTKGWDLYMFLNSTKEKELLMRLPGSATKVLPPATDLSKFFAVQPNYNGGLRLIRHSSQGDNKHPEYTNELIAEIQGMDPKVEFHFMPPRSDCVNHPSVYKYKKNQPPVWEFLGKGNCFLYHLPPNYQDQGPRVLLECAAAGLPAIADNRYGAKDRIIPETGWLVNDRYEVIKVIEEILADLSVLKRKGEAARERAENEFVPGRWAEAIVGEDSDS